MGFFVFTSIKTKGVLKPRTVARLYSVTRRSEKPTLWLELDIMAGGSQPEQKRQSVIVSVLGLSF